MNHFVLMQRRSATIFMQRVLLLLQSLPLRAAIVPALFIVCLLFASTSLSAATGVPVNFVLIRGGEFTMGSPEGEVGRAEAKAVAQQFGIEYSETQHQVRVSDFYMGRYAVTVAEFRQFVAATGYRTDAEKGGFSIIFVDNQVKKGEGVNWRDGVLGRVRPQSEDNHPVLHVSWNDAVAYCQWMSQKTGKRFRLPMEAEREYACRAGSRTPFNTGENLTTAQANYDGNYPYKNNQKGVYRANTVAVNSFAPNAWGLYNMHGNVLEWCSDLYGGSYYDQCKASGTVSNPAGPATGSDRVLRGGSWDDDAGDGRSADRSYDTPDDRNYDAGFRLAFVP